MEQSFDLAGNDIKLIVPRSSDAVMDYYIEAGQSLGHEDEPLCRAHSSQTADCYDFLGLEQLLPAEYFYSSSYVQTN